MLSILPPKTQQRSKYGGTPLTSFGSLVRLSSIDSYKTQNWGWWGDSKAPASHWYLLGTKKVPKWSSCHPSQTKELFSWETWLTDAQKRDHSRRQMAEYPQHVSVFSITESPGVSTEPSFLQLKGIASNLGTERTISSQAERKAWRAHPMHCFLPTPGPHWEPIFHCFLQFMRQALALKSVRVRNDSVEKYGVWIQLLKCEDLWVISSFAPGVGLEMPRIKAQLSLFVLELQLPLSSPS